MVSPGRMVAVVHDTYGGPDVLRLAEVERPDPGPGRVRVRVKACALNGFDLMTRAGTFRPNRAFPHILGCDIAGVVDEYGPGCDQPVPVGAAVVLYFVEACGRCEPCRRGFPTTCLNYRYLGAHLEGGYAEYVVVEESSLIPLGEYDDFIRGAAFPAVFGTCWRALITRAQVRPGETVLVQAAGSGIGIAAIQIARLAGCTVIASAGAADKLERARALGAAHTINYREDDLARAVSEITGKRGVDVVLEHVGGDMWDKVVRSVARNGRIVTVGGVAGYAVSMNIAHVFSKQLSILGSNSVTLAELRDAVHLLLDGRLEPVVDRVFPLAEARAAHEYLADRRQFGKVVLAVDA